MEVVGECSVHARAGVVRAIQEGQNAETRRIEPLGLYPGVEYVTLEGIAQPFPLHFHNFWTIGQLTAGSRCLHCRGEVHHLEAGDFVLFGPGEVHGCEPVGLAPLAYRSVIIPDELYKQVFSECFAASKLSSKLTRRFSQVVVRDEALASAMECLSAYCTQQLPTLDVLGAKEAFCRLLVRAFAFSEEAQVQPTSVRSATTVAAVKQARSTLDEQWSENVSLASLAHDAGLSPYHLIRLFSDEVGLTPHRYLQAVRANRVRDLLAMGMSPTEAAQQAGFSDQAHMTRVYKSFYGITPGRYRAAAQTPLVRKR